MPFERTYVYNPGIYEVTTKEVEEVSEITPKVAIENKTDCILVVSFSAAGMPTITEEIEPGKTLETGTSRGPKTLSGGLATSGSFTVKQKHGADIFRGTVIEVGKPRKHAVKLTVETKN